MTKETKRKLIGYIRVSTIEQNTSRQLEVVKNNLDKIFTDNTSAKDILRPALNEMLSYVREGDTIIVHSIDRLARNLSDLRAIVTDLTEKGIQIQFLKENLSFNGQDSHIDNLLLSVLGSFAEFERALARERQLEGIALAKKNGIYERDRKKKITKKQILEMKEKIDTGVTKTEIAKEFSISRETLYRYLEMFNDVVMV